MKKTKKPGMYLNAKRSVFLKAKILRQRMTIPEQKLWQELKSKNLDGIKFRRQHPILFFVLDFYCHKYQLGIEIDGDNHMNADQKKYDNNRTEVLSQYGVKIIRFKNEQIINDIDSVICEIKKATKKNS